jgi:predicted transposase YdaD
LADVPAGQLPGVVEHMEKRLTAEAAPAEANDLWTAAYVLLGLQYTREFASQLLRSALTMKESVTYQAIIAEGRARGIAEGMAEGRTQGMAQGETLGRTRGMIELLVELGTEHLGPPDAPTRVALEAIADPNRLKELGKRIRQVSSWEELLAPPEGRR